MAGADVRIIAERALVLEVSAADLPDAPGPWLRLWDEWTEDRRPRLVVVHDVDASSEDLEDVAAVCQEWVGEDSALALRYLPLHDDDGSLAGLLDLLTEEVRDYSSGELQVSMCDPEHRALTADARADLVTIVATRAESDEVLDAVLRLMPVDLRSEFARQFASGEIVPVIPVDMVGEAELQDLLDTLSN